MEDANKRRDFIKKTAVAVSSMLLAPTLSSANSFFSGSPNNKVAVGFMGVNGRGTFLAKSFAALPNAEVAFICDVDANVLARTQDTIEKLTGKCQRALQMLEKCWK